MHKIKETKLKALYSNIPLLLKSLQRLDKDFPGEVAGLEKSELGAAGDSAFETSRRQGANGWLHSIADVDDYCSAYLESKLDSVEFDAKDKSSFENSLLIEDSGGLEKFFEKINYNFTDFFKLHRDLPGVNHLVRFGLVKKVEIDGRYYIVKKNNPNKPGRFQLEQKNARLINSMFEDLNIEFDRPDGKKGKISCINYLGYISEPTEEGTLYYSFSDYQEGPTVEQVLLEEKSAEKRKLYLADMKRIFALIEELGIYWGDMAPRNIIMQETADSVTYFLLDFEKTEVLGRKLTKDEKVNLCRGPMVVEEFGAVCSFEELLSVFEEYFDPALWDTKSEERVALAKPKRELLALFDGRGVGEPTIAQYNLLEKEVIGVRLPIKVAGREEPVRPLYVSFKVDHYFGADYDRKTTELFLKANEYGLLPEVAAWFEGVLDAYEEQLTIHSLFLRFESFEGEEVLARAGDSLQSSVDFLLANAESEDSLRDALGRLEALLLEGEVVDFQILYLFLQNQRLGEKLRKLIDYFGGRKVLVFLTGSGSRGDTFKESSDIDLVVVGDEFSMGEVAELEELIEIPFDVTYVKDHLALEAEFAKDPSLRGDVQGGIVFYENIELEMLEEVLNLI